MIFDSEKVSTLVTEWKISHDYDIMCEIVAGTRVLIEVIVSQYDPEYRDDMIQEAFLKLPHALDLYCKNISKLHTFLTTVIHNSCKSYVKKATREIVSGVELPDLAIHTWGDEESLIGELIERNRIRFPSIIACVVDEATEYVYYAIKDGVYGKSRGAIKHLVEEHSFSRYIAIIFYHSTLVYLRTVYRDKMRIHPKDYNREFTLLPELENIVGTETYERASTIFSGMYIKFP